MKKINHKAVWLVILISQILPFIWYVFFSELWIELNNISIEKINIFPFNAFIVGILSSISLSYMMAWIYERMNVNGLKDALITAFIIGFPIAILNYMTVLLFSFRPYALVWLDGGINLILWVIAGGIIGTWKK